MRSGPEGGASEHDNGPVGVGERAASNLVTNATRERDSNRSRFSALPVRYISSKVHAGMSLRFLSLVTSARISLRASLRSVLNGEVHFIHNAHWRHYERVIQSFGQRAPVASTFARMKHP